MIRKEEIYKAYKNAKITCFYDKTNLVAEKFADYESNLVKNLDIFHKEINNYLSSSNKKWFESPDFIGTSKLKFKKLDIFEVDNQNIFYSKKKEKIKKNIKESDDIDFRIMADVSIPFHILSELWVSKVGVKIDNKFEDYLYGNRLRKSKDFNNGHFKSYIGDYKRWQNDGINSISELIKKKKNVLAFTLDIEKYYHSIDIQFLKDYNDKIAIDNTLKSINNLLINCIEKWNEYNENNNPFDELKELGIPIGLSASKIIANAALLNLDDDIKIGLRPLFYGRYVDDIFIVLENYKNQYEDIKVTEIFKNIPNFEVKDKVEKLEYNTKTKSSILINNDKCKFFILEGESGEIFLTSLKESLNQMSSEWKLPPNIDDDIISYKDEVVKLNNNNKELVTGIRKTDDISIQRNNLILFIVKTSIAIELIPKKEWSSKLEDFVNISCEYIITNGNFIKFLDYIPKIIALTLKAKEYRLTKKLVKKFLVILDALEQVEIKHSFLIEAINYEKEILVETFLKNIVIDERNEAEIKEMIDLLKIKKDDILNKSKIIFLTDFHSIPYKKYFLDTDLRNIIKLRRLDKTISEGNLCFDNDIKKIISKFFNIIVNVKTKSKRKMNSYPISYIFYTRAFETYEISILFKEKLTQSNG
jgi:hypothetical protein